MNYCENCYLAFMQERCPLCGSKKFRNVQDDDYCLLTETASSNYETLKEIFEEHDISCSALPYGNGIEAHFALPSSNYRLYVPFRSLQTAKNILREIENNKTEELRNCLLSYGQQLNVNPKTEKKIRKKLKLSENNDFFAHCINIIKSSTKIEYGGDYVYCYSDSATLVLNFKTYEILSLTTR